MNNLEQLEAAIDAVMLEADPAALRELASYHGRRVPSYLANAHSAAIDEDLELRDECQSLANTSRAVAKLLAVVADQIERPAIGPVFLLPELAEQLRDAEELPEQ